MGPQMVVVLSPRFDLGTGVFEQQEPVQVQTVLRLAASEGFDQRAVHGLARPRTEWRDPSSVEPLLHSTVSPYLSI